MNRTDRERARLIALNAGLLALLGVVTLGPMTQAQQNRRAPGEYTMVASRPQGLSEDALHIVDATNMELLSIRYDSSAKELRFIDFRDLNVDLDTAERGGGR